MNYVLIRDIPEDVLVAIDARAGRLGVSRNEYILRLLARDVIAATLDVTAGDLQLFAKTFGDLDDGTIMGEAWR